MVPALLLTGFLAGVAALSPGCRTVTSTEVVNGVTNQVVRTELDPVRTADAIRAVVPAGVAIAVEKDRNCVPYLQLAEVALRLAANSGQYEPAQVRSALQSISVRELRTPEAAAVIEAGLGIYSAFVAEAVSKRLDLSEWAQPLLLAIADGIGAALPAE